MYMYTYVYVVYIYKNMYIYMYMHTYIYVHTHTTRIYIWQVAVLANIIPTLLDAAPGRRVRSVFKKRSRTFAKAISVVRLTFVSVFLMFMLCSITAYYGTFLRLSYVSCMRLYQKGSPFRISRHRSTWMHRVTHTWMSVVTCMNESCQIYVISTSKIWMSHVLCMNEPC